MKRSQRRQMQEAIKEIPFAVFCLDTEKNDDASKLAETMKAPFFTSPESMEKAALYGWRNDPARRLHPQDTPAEAP